MAVNNNHNDSETNEMISDNLGLSNVSIEDDESISSCLTRVK